MRRARSVARVGRRARWLVSCIALALAACGETTAPSLPLDPTGWWGGMTAQNLPILFEVDTLGVRQMQWGYEMPPCVSGSVRLGSTYSTYAVIENAEFTLVADFSDLGASVFVVNGKFASSTTVSGTLAVNRINCDVTLDIAWAASKLTTAPAAALLPSRSTRELTVVRTSP